MILDKHWWRTTDGRLVPHEHPDAAFLAYPKGHEVPDALAEKFGLKAAVEAETKQAPKAADKQAPKAEDKAGKRPPTSGPGSGVEAWRQYAAETLGEPVTEFAELSREEIIGLLPPEEDG